MKVLFQIAICMKSNQKTWNFMIIKRTLQKVIDIENRTGNNSNCHISHNIKFSPLTYNVNPINGKINSSDDKQISLSSSGGILSDMMGLGKTITIFL